MLFTNALIATIAQRVVLSRPLTNTRIVATDMLSHLLCTPTIPNSGGLGRFPLLLLHHGYLDASNAASCAITNTLLCWHHPRSRVQRVLHHQPVVACILNCPLHCLSLVPSAWNNGILWFLFA